MLVPSLWLFQHIFNLTKLDDLSTASTWNTSNCLVIFSLFTFRNPNHFPVLRNSYEFSFSIRYIRKRDKFLCSNHFSFSWYKMAVPTEHDKSRSHFNFKWHNRVRRVFPLNEKVIYGFGLTKFDATFDLSFILFIYALQTSDIIVSE